MTVADTDEVRSAFGLLGEELVRALDDVKDQAAEAVRADRFADSHQLIDTAGGIEALRRNLSELADRWAQLQVPRRPGVADLPGDEPAGQEELPDEDGVSRRNLGRLARGVRTPEAAFRRPVLEALAELGGTATIGDVLQDVEHRMESQLAEVDYQTLPSDADQIRWRNTAQWARNELVKSGLMLPSTERGVWSISEAGSRWLTGSGRP